MNANILLIGLLAVVSVTASMAVAALVTRHDAPVAVAPRAAVSQDSVPQAARPAATGQPDRATIERRVAELQDRLDAEPDDLDGWKMLGRSLIALERYMEATGAWSQAAQLAPSDPEVRGALATLEDVARRSRAHDAARDAAAAADSAGSDGSSRMTDR